MKADVKKILEKEGIREFKEDIRQMSRRELRQTFSFKTNGSLNVTLLMKNLVWQAFTWIQDGRMEPVEGNIRSFWYMNVKPVLSRLGFKISGDRYTAKLYDVFVEMTTVHRLFRYGDFGFIDERAYARAIGKNNGNFILFVEKDGLFSVVKGVAEANGTTAISLGGFPSYLTTEYLVRSMAGQGLLRSPVRLVSVVDYDPSGYWIEREFIEQLENYQVKVASVYSVVIPSVLPEELVLACRYKLKQDSRTSNWLKVTGGISGQAYGLEADALGGRCIREELLKAIVQPYLDSKEAIVAFEQDKARQVYFKWLSGK
jgi:hypothetical protein